MVEICLISSATCPNAIFNQDHGLYRTSKDFQPFLPSHSKRHDLVRSGRLQLRPPQLEDPWRFSSPFPESNQSAWSISNTSRHVLGDMQDTRPDSVLFSFGIAEQCTRHEKILQILKSGTSKTGLSFSLLSDQMGLHTVAIDMHPQPLISLDDEFCLYEIGVNNSQPSLIYPRREFYTDNPLLDFARDFAHSSKITVDPDGQVLFIGTRAEVKDLLAVIGEFYLTRNSTKCNKQPMLVPHFTRLDDTNTQASLRGSSLKLQTVTVAPLKSPEKFKSKPTTRKAHGKKSGRERDLYEKNFFHACESLLTVILDKGRAKKTALISLKKSGPELPKLLTQLSAGVTGTGLAIIFSVISRVVGGRAPFSATKLLDVGLGFGLVWLSWALSRLRDSIILINKNSSSRFGLKEEEEIMSKIDKSMRKVLFWAATLMAVSLLRFA